MKMGHMEMTEIPLEEERFVRLTPTVPQSWCSAHKYRLLLWGLLLTTIGHAAFTLCLWTRLAHSQTEIDQIREVLESVQLAVSKQTQEQRQAVQSNRTDVLYDKVMPNYTETQLATSPSLDQMEEIKNKLTSLVDHRSMEMEEGIIQKIEKWENITKTRIQNSLRLIDSQCKNETLNLKDKIVPPGFTYIQHGNQTDPRRLWPFYTWTDITPNYAGQFFRAEGTNSAPFNKTQPENSPRVTQVSLRTKNGNTFDESVSLSPGETSKTVKTAGKSGDWFGLDFFTSSGEVRPYNSAIRIWKRMA